MSLLLLIRTPHYIKKHSLEYFLSMQANCYINGYVAISRCHEKFKFWHPEGIKKSAKFSCCKIQSNNNINKWHIWCHQIQFAITIEQTRTKCTSSVCKILLIVPLEMYIHLSNKKSWLIFCRVPNRTYLLICHMYIYV